MGEAKTVRQARQTHKHGKTNRHEQAGRPMGRKADQWAERQTMGRQADRQAGRLGRPGNNCALGHSTASVKSLLGFVNIVPIMQQHVQLLKAGPAATRQGRLCLFEPHCLIASQHGALHNPAGCFHLCTGSTLRRCMHNPSTQKVRHFVCTRIDYHSCAHIQLV